MAWPPGPRDLHPGVLNDFARSRQREVKESWTGARSMRTRSLPRFTFLRRVVARIRGGGDA